MWFNWLNRRAAIHRRSIIHQAFIRSRQLQQSCSSGAISIVNSNALFQALRKDFTIRKTTLFRRIKRRTLKNARMLNGKYGAGGEKKDFQDDPSFTVNLRRRRKEGKRRSAQIPRLETESGAVARTAFIKTVQFALNGFLHPGLWVLSAAPADHIPPHHHPSGPSDCN